MIKVHLSKVLGERRMTQKELAEMSGVRPATIHMIYHEKAKRIDLDVLDRICTALDIQPGELLERVKEK